MANTDDDMIDLAMGLISNVDGGTWKQKPEWANSAKSWIDQYYERAKNKPIKCCHLDCEALATVMIKNQVDPYNATFACDAHKEELTIEDDTVFPIEESKNG